MPKATAHLSLGLVAAVAVLAVGSAVAARPQPPAQPGAGAPSVLISLRASLSASQVPSLQVVSTATGRFVGALVRSGFGGKGQKPNLSWSLVWVVTVRKATGPVTGVEIRSGEVRAVSGSTFLKLCGPCTETSTASASAPGSTVLTGQITTLTRAQVAALRQGELWVNVMTAANPAGELRGEITRRKPVIPNVPPNTRMPNPLKPTPGQQQIPPPIKIPGPSD